MKGTIIVFARVPEPGRVKTRLAAALGDEATLALYRAFLQDTLTAARKAGAGVMLCHTPTAESFPEQALADEVFEQVGGTFGDRFDEAFAEARRRTPPDEPLLLVGADTPHLSPEALRRGLDALAEQDAVIGPSTEGGFHALGFRSRIVPVNGIFDGPNECARLAVLLRDAKLSTGLLEPFFDVDVPDDLANLILYLDVLDAAGADWMPTNTAQSIRDLGIRAVPVEGTRGFRIERRKRPQ